MTIAIITARGGSKRIPRKNIKPFLGKPIIQYSIEAARQSGVFDTVMVSTDDTEVAEVAKSCGAAIPFMRSEETSNDYAVTSAVLREVLDTYERNGQVFKSMCCIYPTAPFITAARLREGMELLASTGADSVIPVVRFSFPPQRGLILDNGCLRMMYSEYLNTRSQDIKPMYHDAGQFYCASVDAFMREGKLLMNNTIPLILSENEVQDIDTPDDWEIAETKYKILKGNEYGAI
jgi:N-acylneuraminate cytidylyltransferase